MPKTHYLKVPAAMCRSCSSVIKGAIQDRISKGLIGVTVNLQSRVVELVIADDVDAKLLEEAIAELQNDGFVAKESYRSISYYWLIGLLTIGMGITVTFFAVSPLLVGISVLVAGFLGRETYYRAWRGEPKDILFTISIVLLIGISALGLLFPAIHPLFSMAFLTLGSQLIGVAIQERMQSASSQLTLLATIPPWYVLNPEKSPLSISELKPGQEIELPQGAVIPVDVICDQDCELLDVRSDGQTHKMHYIQAGKIIKQGMQRNSDTQGTLKATVKNTYSESHLSKMQNEIDVLQEPKDPPYFKNVLKYFFPILIGIAVATTLIHYFYLVYLVTGFSSAMLTQPYFYSFLTALSTGACVLTSACPCVLGLISGLSSVVMRQSMQKNEIDPCFVRIPEREITDCVFDLNGTLTETHPTIEKIESFGIEEEELKKVIYALEKKADHPIAKTICNHIGEESEKCSPVNWVQKRSSVEGTLDGVRYRISNELHDAHQAALGDQQKTMTYVERITPSLEAKGDDAYEKIGAIEMKLIWRDFAVEMINGLVDEGKTVHICTGAKNVLLPDGIRNKEAICLAKDCATRAEYDEKGTKIKDGKLEYILSLKKQGKGVLMVGDSGNDVLPLAASDMAITMKSKAFDLASQAVSILSVDSLKTLRDNVRQVERSGEHARQFRDMAFGIVTVFNFLMMFSPMAMTALGGMTMPVWIGPCLMLAPLLPLGLTVYCYYEKVDPSGSPVLHDSSAAICKGLSLRPLVSQPASKMAHQPAIQSGTIDPPVLTLTSEREARREWCGIQ